MFVHLPHVVIGPVLFPLQAACPLSRIIWLRSFIRSSNSYTGWQATGAGGNQWRRLWTLHFHRYTFLLTNPRTLFFSDNLVPIISNKRQYNSSCLMVGWSIRSFIRSTAPLAAKRPTGGRWRHTVCKVSPPTVNHIWQVESSQKTFQQSLTWHDTSPSGWTATRSVSNRLS